MEDIKYTPKEEIDASADNMGSEYESKVTLLTSLAACLCFEKFEIKTNVNGYTPLDDICLSVWQGNEETLYLFQLKHVAKTTKLNESLFVKKNEMSKPKFDLDRYYNKYMELYKKLNKKIIFIFYTNYTLDNKNNTLNLFSENNRDDEKFLKMINTSQVKTYSLNYKEYDSIFIKNSYFFINQQHNDSLHKSILKILNEFEIGEILCKLIIDDLLHFFNNFCKTVKDKPILTKTLILRILYFTCLYHRSYTFNEFITVNNDDTYYPPHLWEFIKTNKVIIKKQYKEKIKHMILNDTLINNDENDIYLNIIFKHSKSTYTEIMNYFVACCHGVMPFLVKYRYYEEIQNIISKFNHFRVIFISKNSANIDSKIIVDVDSLLCEEVYNLDISLRDRSSCLIKHIFEDKDDLKMILDNINISELLNIYDRNQHKSNNEEKIELDRFIYNIIVDKSVLVNLGTDLLIILNFTHQKRDLLNYINLIIPDNLILDENNLARYTPNIKVIISKNADIDSKLNNYTRNIHYFRFEDDFLYWRGTMGKTDNLNFIKIDETKTLQLSEILHHFKYNKLIVFSGVPGIGKSISMRQISKIIAPHIFVLLINLREKEKILNKLINEKNVSCLEILRLLINEQNSFYLNMFEIKFRQNNILVILDGYDEIAPKFVKVTNTIIHNILDKNTKVILTTRSVLQNQVEEEFLTKSLILKPFDLAEQREYLEKYFSTNINDMNCNIPDICENTIKKIKNDEIGDVSFNSVPLHLEIISKILLDTLKQNKYEYENIKINKLQIYEIFIERKLEILMEKTKIINIDDIEIRTYHQNFSLKQIFSNIEFETNIVESVKIFSEKLRRGAEKTGILIDDVNEIFIHRTIAEYFTALWLIDNFENNNFCKKLLINEINKSEYLVIFDFFNSLLFNNTNVCNKIILNKIDEITQSEVHEVYKLNRNILHLLFSNLNQNKVDKAIDNRVGQFLKNILLENQEMLKQKDDFGLFPIDYVKKIVKTNELIITIKFEALNIFFHFNQKFNLLEFLICENIKVINSELKFENGIDILTFGFNKNSLYQVNLMFLIKNYDPIKLNSNKLSCYEKGFNWLLFDCKENINHLHHVAMDVNLLSLSKYLLNINNNISTWQDNENSPIHYACEHIYIEFIKFFMENGAKLELKNSVGFDCFDIITKNDNLISSKGIFQKNGIFYDQFNKFNKYLILNENKKYLKFLLENNCNSKELTIYNQLENFPEQLLLFKYFLKQEVCNEENNTILHLIVLDEKRQLPNNEIYTANVLCLFRKLIETNYDINIKNIKGLSSLHLAVTNNDIQMVILLFEKNADIETVDINFNTPLICASINQNLEVIKILLNFGAKVNAVNKKQECPLHQAVAKKELKIVEILLENKADVETIDIDGSTPLFWAVGYQNFDAVKMLINFGAKVNAVNKKQECPLHQAVTRKELKIVEILLKNKADIEAININGSTPLFWAVNHQNFDAVKMLINFGAKVNAVDKKQECPLHKAVAYKELKIVEILLENKADVEAIHIDGDTPLFWAVNYQNFDAVKMLINFGANVNAVNKEQECPLHQAVANKELKIIEILLENKADIEAININGSTPLFWAVGNQNFEAVKMLINFGAKVNAVNKKQECPLHRAVEYNKVDITQFLLKNNADIDVININGDSPLFCAVSHQNFDAVKMLLSFGAKIGNLDKFNISRKTEIYKLLVSSSNPTTSYRNEEPK